MGDLPTPPPLARREPAVRELHGEHVTDDYAWMRGPDHGPLMEYLRAERAYYDAESRRLDALAERLAAEAAGRVPGGPEDSVTWPRDGFLYRTRIPEGADNEQLVRSADADADGDPNAEDRDGPSSEEILLDENLLARATGFIELGIREPSPDGALLAWSADLTGAEIYELRFRDLRTGQDLPEVIARSSPGAAWSTDSAHLLYLAPDRLNRQFQVWRHRIGTPAEEDVLVLEEADQRFELTLCASRSGELAIITSASRDTTEVHVIRLAGLLSDPILVEPRRRGIEYRIDHARGEPDGLGTVFVVTNDGAPEFTLLRAPARTPGREHWEPVTCPAVAPARTDTRLLACDVLAGHLVLRLRRGCRPLLVITDHDGAQAREIPPAPAAGAIRLVHAEDYDAGSVIVAEESLVEPPVWSRLQLDGGGRQMLKRLEVPGYDPARYRTERFSAPAADGTAIPVTVARREDVALDGRPPCLLYGYGAYEDSIDPRFQRSLPSLLDRGVVFAIAHIRGGGECGRAWWEQGRLRAKPTTFRDHLAVADWLAESGLVDGQRIVSRGASAGGLLQGAVFSMRPDRWRAIVAEVPFVDVVSTMLDPSIPLTVTEWDEWGDPRDPGDYACMRSYSPYDNPPSGSRPPMLVTGAANDPRVGIHEPAKWVARLRATDTAGSRLLFRPELGAGAHMGPSGRGGRLRYEADVQAFVLDAMGLSE